MRYLSLLFIVFLLIIGTTVSIAASEYVGRQACVDCHSEQENLWKNSHHDLAMQPANPETVLGDFNQINFTYAGITSTFYKKQKRFMVRTDGPDGKLQDFEIKYVFGVSPLQQYLIPLSGGRLQALTIAWDTRPEKEGGQRWFHLYPKQDITFLDELHWTRSNFTWNGMCAECHSTGLQKNYNANADTFKTSWSEIDVSCEACHGPASNHIVWAHKKPGWESLSATRGLAHQFNEYNEHQWVIDPQTGTAKNSKGKKTNLEIGVCAQCHARRSKISDSYQPGKSFTDHYRPRLLDNGMYFADGQIEEEVYVYGSFLQSKMYQKGVACSDCHEPHSLKLRQTGNRVCLRCHASKKFNTKAHHFHIHEGKGGQCAECHMPAKTYMVVDPRHDHSIRIPRPDLSVKFGTPNACNQCHQDKNAEWAVNTLSGWYGDIREGHQSYAEALHAGRLGTPDAGLLLASRIEDLQTPDIVAASAVSLLPAYLNASNIDMLKKALNDDRILVRMAAVGVLENIPVQMRVPLAFPLLTDSEKVVRIEAARVLASVPSGDLPEAHRKKLGNATLEYLESQQINADRPEAQLNLGNYFIAIRELGKAENAYSKAITLDLTFIPAYINLADLYRLQNKDQAAGRILRQALEKSSGNANVHFALGLLMTRQKQTPEAVEQLASAVKLAPDNARYVYVYGVALNSTGKAQKAMEILRLAHERFPSDVDILSALVAFHRDAGHAFTARIYRTKLQQLNR